MNTNTSNLIYLELVQLSSIEDSIFIGVAELEYSFERADTCRLQNL